MLSVKRFIIGVVVLICLLLLLAVGGAVWTMSKVRDNLTAPADPSGQKSIAEYAHAIPRMSVAKPVLVADFDWNSIDTPPKSTRAWTRWWWPGGDVDSQTLTNQLKELHAAGFGGAEVQPFISGMQGIADDIARMAKVYQFDTPAYYETLGATLMAAKSLGMQLDLTHFSGWPPGGPEINLKDSPTVIAYSEVSVTGGDRIEVTLPRPGPGPGEYMFSMSEFAGADFINFPADHARLLSVVAARATDGEHAWNPFTLDDTVALDERSLQVITVHVKDGVLHWDAPPGEWRIVASYLLPSGEVPMGAAQKPQGFVVDHLRRDQVIGHYEYAFGERTGLPAHYGEGLRGIFNDSLEFRLRRMSVDDILPEFQTRRGYDLEPYLPVIFIEGADNAYFREIIGIPPAPEFRITADDDRIRRDYQQTLSDLVIERFVETSMDWAEKRGLISRGQSYGMDIDLLRALGANTIPETEQLWAEGADAGLKFASSAAALYGRPLTSAESFVWINRDYTPTARRIKAAADKLFLAGVNHIVYHGTPYPWTAGDSGVFGEQGWNPFSGPGNPAHVSTDVSPRNTALWPDVPALNSYIARSQNLLRQGGPAVDVLIYYPFLGYHGPRARAETSEALLTGSLPDADPERVALADPALTAGRQLLDRLVTVPPQAEDERVAWLQQLQPLLQALDSRGISWGWVNDHALQSGLLAPGVLTASGGEYRGILLPNVERIEPATLASLQRLTAQGVPVYLAGTQPYAQPGFRDAQAGDRAVQEGVTAMLAKGARALQGDEVVRELWALSDTLKYTGDSTIRRYRRLLENGSSVQFFANQSPAAASVTLQVPNGLSAWWFDASEGAAWPAQVEAGQLQLSLRGYDSRFLIVGVPLPQSLRQQVATVEALEIVGRRWPLQSWKFDAENFSVQWDTLPDWRNVNELRHARSGRYLNSFTLDHKVDAARYLLDLGLVQGSAAVSINGTMVGRASMPPFTLDVTSALVSGENKIEIEVLAPLRNVFVGKALQGDQLHRHMTIYAGSLVAAGMMGPVLLAEVQSAAGNIN
jgi:hypothetical protein